MSINPLVWAKKVEWKKSAHKSSQPRMVKGTQNTRSKKENKNKFLPEAPNEKSAVNGNRM